MTQERTDRRHEETPDNPESYLETIFKDVAPAVRTLTSHLAEPKSYSETYDILRGQRKAGEGIYAAIELGMIYQRSSDDKLVNTTRYTRQLPLPGFDPEEQWRAERGIPAEFPIFEASISEAVE